MDGIKIMEFLRSTQDSKQWEEWVPINVAVRDKHFLIYHFKLNGVVYEVNSLEFQEALNKELMWEELQK